MIWNGERQQMITFKNKLNYCTNPLVLWIYTNWLSIPNTIPNSIRKKWNPVKSDILPLTLTFPCGWPLNLSLSVFEFDSVICSAKCGLILAHFASSVDLCLFELALLQISLRLWRHLFFLLLFTLKLFELVQVHFWRWKRAVLLSGSGFNKRSVNY